MDTYDIFIDNKFSGTMLQFYKKNNCLFIGNLIESTELINKPYDPALILKCWEFLVKSMNLLHFI